MAGRVDELLRYHCVVDWVAFDRVALDDVQIGGRLIRAGEGIFVLGASANHDERIFSAPERFDLHRREGGHLGFGFGLHHLPVTW